MMHPRNHLLIPLFMLPSLLSAQSPGNFQAGRKATPADSLPATIAEAEARSVVRAGAQLPAVSIDPRDKEFIEAAVGTTERKCVAVSGVGRMRSGDFVAAMPGFTNPANRGTKVMWISTRPAPSGTRYEMKVTATRIDAPGEGRVYGMDTLNAPRYPSGPTLPTAGKWMLVATAGAAWGCFVVTVD